MALNDQNYCQFFGLGIFFILWQLVRSLGFQCEFFLNFLICTSVSNKFNAMAEPFDSEMKIDYQSNDCHSGKLLYRLNDQNHSVSTCMDKLKTLSNIHCCCFYRQPSKLPYLLYITDD